MSTNKNKKETKKAKKLSRRKQLKADSENNLSKTKRDLQSYICIAVILLITSGCFYTSLNNGYVNWDDDKNFAENELITTINDKTFWENSSKIFKTHVIGNYNPLSIFSFAVEQKVFGLDQPYYWHRDNLLLHLGCVFFIFFIGKRLGLGYWGASILALLFGIHPMRVESVAWLTERKDVLYGFFYLAAMFYYIKGKQVGFKKRYLAIIAVTFLLSLLSKVQAVILPISLILVDYYLSKDSKITLRSILTKSPLLLGSLIMGFVNIHFLSLNGSIGEQEYSGLVRVFIGSFSLVVYYIKSLIPYELSPLYPYPAQIPTYFYVSILSFVATAALLIYSYIKKWNVVFFGVGFFMANVFLLLQILGAGQGFLADRFTYIAYIGLFFMYAYGIEKLIAIRPVLKLPILIATGFILTAYGVMTFNQNKIWKDSGTLWTHTLKYYSKSTLPWGNRANYYRDNKEIARALHDYSQVIRLAPNKAEPYNSRARLYFNFNERDSLLKALTNYNMAIKLDPGNVEFIVNRGATYAKLGDGSRALENLNEAEKVDPSFANIYLNRSVINNVNGNYPAALIDIDKYLSLKPNFPDMWYEKCRLNNHLNNPSEGLKAANQAIAMNNRKGLYYYERANSYYRLGQSASAKGDIQAAQKLGHKGDPEMINMIMSSQ